MSIVYPSFHLWKGSIGVLAIETHGSVDSESKIQLVRKLHLMVPTTVPLRNSWLFQFYSLATFRPKQSIK